MLETLVLVKNTLHLFLIILGLAELPALRQHLSLLMHSSFYSENTTLRFEVVVVNLGKLYNASMNSF